MTIPHDTPDPARQLGRVPLFQGLAADVLARIRGQAQVEVNAYAFRFRARRTGTD